GSDALRYDLLRCWVSAGGRWSDDLGMAVDRRVESPQSLPPVTTNIQPRYIGNKQTPRLVRGVCVCGSWWITPLANHTLPVLRDGRLGRCISVLRCRIPYGGLVGWNRQRRFRHGHYLVAWSDPTH